MEKFPIFEIETTDNKITIHGAVGNIIFYDYDRAEAVKQYKAHFNQVQRREVLRESMENISEVAEKMKRVTETIARMTAIFGGIYGI